MIQVDIDIVIHRPPDEVFAFVSNYENNPLWQSGVKEARFTSDNPFGLGSTYVQVSTFLGRRIETAFEVVEYEPGRVVKATSTSGSFPVQFRRWVEPVEGGTRVRATITGDASGFFKLAEPLLAGMVKRQIEGDYANLKKVMEES